MGRIGITDSAYYEGVAEKIREKLGVSEQYAPSQLAEKVVAVYDKGYEVGSAEGGNAEESYQQGYQEGKAEAYAEVESVNAELETALNGGDTGGKGYYDEFWDEFQANGARSNYNFGFGGIGWTDQTFKPKYNIRPNYACIGMFYYCAVTDLEARLRELGITLDLSDNANYSTLFFGASCTVIPEVKFSSAATTLSEAFAYCRFLHTVRKIVLSDGFKVNMNTSFNACYALENIEFEGIIPANISFKDSTKLTKASITSIMEHLSTTASGQTATFSKTAVETAFGSTTGAEWTALKATRSNWTISLV